MAGEYYLLQPSFTTGEISKEVANRTDMDKYNMALITASNVYIRPYGPVYRRSGALFCTAAKYTDKQARLVRFNFAQNVNYLLEVGDKYIRVHRDGGYIGVELTTPFPESILSRLRFTQSADVLYIASGDYQVKELLRYSENDWQLKDFEISESYFDPMTGSAIVDGNRYIEPGTHTFVPKSSGAYKITVSSPGGGRSESTFWDTDGGNENQPSMDYTYKRYFKGGKGNKVTQTMQLTSGQSYTITIGVRGQTGYPAQTSYGSSTFTGLLATAGGTTSFDTISVPGGSGAAWNANGGSTGNGQGGLGGYVTTKPYQSYEVTGRYEAEGGYVEVSYAGDNFLTPSAISGLGVEITATKDTFSTGQEGSYIKLYQERPAVLRSVTTGTGESVLAGAAWKLLTHGHWGGTVTLQHAKDGVTWKDFRKYTSKYANSVGDNNVNDGDRVTEYTYFRLVLEITAGSCTADLTALPYNHEGTAKIVQVVSPIKVLVDVAKEFASIEKTTEYAFSPWSGAYGYPSCACFFQDRLCFAANKKYPHMLWMSRTGDYKNFSVEKAAGTVTDDSAIAVALISREQFKIMHLIPATDLVVLTEGNEWIISGNETVTPTKITPKMQTGRGVANCTPLNIGGRTVYVQGSGSTVRDMGYSFDSDSYAGLDLTLLAKQVIKGVQLIDSAYSQEPDSIIYFIRSDGVIACLTYIREQEVYAWSTLNTDGAYESVEVVPEVDGDKVYVLVKREVNGQTVRYLECFSLHSDSSVLLDYVMTDSAKVFIFDSLQAEITGLEHLSGKLVDVIGDGRLYEKILVDNTGKITLPTPVKQAVAGLRFESKIELPNCEMQLKDGTMQTRLKQISTAILRLENSLGGKVGTTFGRQDEVKYNEYDTDKAMSLFSGDKSVTLPVGGYLPDGRVCITLDKPFPFNLLAVVRVVTFGGKGL